MRKAFIALLLTFSLSSCEELHQIAQHYPDVATQYLKRTTRSKLESEFSPITKMAIEDVHVTKYWDDVAETYNSVPLVKPVNPDLEQNVNKQATDGLFKLVAQEEKRIREDPAARATDILKRVFGYNG